MFPCTQYSYIQRQTAGSGLAPMAWPPTHHVIVSRSAGLHRTYSAQDRCIQRAHIHDAHSDLHDRRGARDAHDPDAHRRCACRRAPPSGSAAHLSRASERRLVMVVQLPLACAHGSPRRGARATERCSSGSLAWPRRAGSAARPQLLQCRSSGAASCPGRVKHACRHHEQLVIAAAGPKYCRTLKMPASRKSAPDVDLQRINGRALRHETRKPPQSVRIGARARRATRSPASSWVRSEMGGALGRARACAWNRRLARCARASGARRPRIGAASLQAAGSRRNRQVASEYF